MLEFGEISGPDAEDFYQKSADLGNLSAMFSIASKYSERQEYVKAIAQYHVAAMSGHQASQMALGYRYLYGVGVPKDCSQAVIYYELAANGIILSTDFNLFTSNSLYKHSKLYEEDFSKRRYEKATETELMQYYQFSAEAGNADAQLFLAQRMYSRNESTRNLIEALRLFREASENENGSVSVRMEAKAALAHMLMHGHGVENGRKNHQAAKLLWKESAGYDIASAHNGLGVLYMNEGDYKNARSAFVRAIELNSVEALYNLGLMHLRGFSVTENNRTSESSFPAALHYLTLAAQRGHIPSMWKVAHMHLHGIGTNKSCSTAVHLYRTVAERGGNGWQLQHEAKNEFANGKVERAAALYSRAAEQGYVEAQMNAGWLFDNMEKLRNQHDGFMHHIQKQIRKLIGYNYVYIDKKMDSQNRKIYKLQETNQRAERLYSSAAKQGNVRAVLALGDWYYYQGMSDFDSSSNIVQNSSPLFGIRWILHGVQLFFQNFLPSIEKPTLSVHQTAALKAAVSQYRAASKAGVAQAQFNLGFCYHFGIGVKKDFHLAKRFYDQALEMDSRSWAPTSIALATLRIHMHSHPLVRQLQQRYFRVEL
eukprot:g5407.t1